MPWRRGWRHRGLLGPLSGTTRVAPGGTSGSNQKRRVAFSREAGSNELQHPGMPWALR